MQVFVTTGVPRNEGLKLVESYVATLHRECYVLSDITYMYVEIGSGGEVVVNWRASEHL